MDYTVYYDLLRRTSLFRGMDDADLDTLMDCFSPRVRGYERGELLLMPTSRVSYPAISSSSPRR